MNTLRLHPGRRPIGLAFQIRGRLLHVHALRHGHHPPSEPAPNSTGCKSMPFAIRWAADGMIEMRLGI